MISLREPLPKYLLSKHQLTWTVTFSALFAIVTILLSFPFDRQMWFTLSNRSVFVSSVLFVISAALVVCFSRVLMYRTGKKGDIAIVWYVLWNLAEIVFVSVWYTAFTRISEAAGVFPVLELSTGLLLLRSFIFCLVALGVPYLVASLYLALENKNNIIRLMNFSNVVSDTPDKPYEEKRITLFDSTGVLKFSIESDNLYYIESDDNYIKVWYTDSSAEIKQYMLRCPLKTVEESFAGSELVRCHRKFIVNITKVRILKSGKEGYKIDIGLDGVDFIPISKTYEQNVLARFNSR